MGWSRVKHSVIVACSVNFGILYLITLFFSFIDLPKTAVNYIKENDAHKTQETCT